ncbi:MAG: cysteine desulfurase [Candidatus Abawacabacteria bacterium]|nr:cysteine desulfurase [Candidatus Abawacabacteria bacterium]
MVYLDYASATPVDPQVLEVMLPYFSHYFANPSSLYSAGKTVREAVERARSQVAAAIGASAEEIVFTSGGTEANNLAVLGTARTKEKETKHLVVSAIEHDSLLRSCRALVSEGWQLSYIPILKSGLIDLSALEKMVTSPAALYSVMLANSEIGTIQPLAEIVTWAKKTGAYVHSDACQALGYVPINVKTLSIDLLSLNSVKVYGPKGVGALYVRKGIQLQPLVWGGKQEYGLRAGTENVPGIVGFGKACEMAVATIDEEVQRITDLRDWLLNELLKISGARLNGDRTSRLANNINISFTGIESEALVFYLDQAGVCVSAASTCTQASMSSSHVLIALGLDEQQRQGSVRLTLGRQTTWEEVEKVVPIISAVVEKLRF